MVGRGYLELDIVLFLAGSALAVAALGIIVYRGVPNRNLLRAEAPPTVSNPAPIAKIEEESEPQPVSEAPPPFSDDGAFSGPKKATLPTDTTALGATSPFLVISVPKSVHRTRPKTTRKRRVTKIDSIPSVTGSPIDRIDNPTTREPPAP
jgi:hypothetical protein